MIWLMIAGAVALAFILIAWGIYTTVSSGVKQDRPRPASSGATGSDWLDDDAGSQPDTAGWFSAAGDDDSQHKSGGGWFEGWFDGGSSEGHGSSGDWSDSGSSDSSSGDWSDSGSSDSSSSSD
jgi:hypothetical protein